MTALTGFLDPSLIAEVRRIELKTKRSVDTDFSGQYRTAFRGSGLVFSDVREYQPGDDVRAIHWKLSARTNKVYVKSFEEDRQLRIMLALDISRSTLFGQGKSKHRLALEFAALLSFLTQKNGDAFGLCLFSGSVEEYLKPTRNKKQTSRTILSLLTHRELHRSTNIRAALQKIRVNERRRSVVFIVSDFLSENFEQELRALSFAHEVVCVFLESPLDIDLPRAGIVEWEDAETGERILLDLSSNHSRQKYMLAHEKIRDDLRDSCSKLGADFLVLRDNPVQPLRELMNRRVRRIR